jgi:hypothetical protein
VGPMGWGWMGMRESGCLGRRGVRFAAGIGLIGLSSQVLALGLGDPSVTSVLGQPLQLTVPLVTDAGTELTQDCVRIVPGGQIGDAIPSLNAGRITIEPERGQLRIEGLQPVTEPALRVTVEAGCNERIRREFSLLVDPPAMPQGQSNVAGPGSAQAALGGIGLGMAQISAVLGQRLSIRVPAVGPDASTLTEQCVHLADPISSEGAPVLRQATIRVSPQPTGALIEVATAEPVIEPAVRIALDVGCRDPLRREYAILLGLPTLAVSNLTAEEPAAAAPEPKPAPRPVAKTPPRVTAVPVAPTPTRPSAAARAEAATEPVAKPARRVPTGDRLVLGAPDDSIRPAPNADVASAAPDVNAELSKRIEAMSRQIEALETQLAASRLRQQELERQAMEARERWTWLMAAFGVLLLGSALLLAWRQRVPAAQSGWGPVAHQPARVASTQPKPAAARPELAIPVPGIGGRATMPPGRSISAPTEPSIPDDRHTHITVTELHDTVQVIKELYATVLERNTSGSPVVPQQPLELDLRTPTAGAAAAESPRLLGDQVPPGDVRLGAEHGPASEGRFTELPTEVGLDLDLSSALIPVEGEAFDLPGDKSASGLAAAAPQLSRTPPPSLGRDGVPAGGSLTQVPARDGFPAESQTQVPTEVSLDIDVGRSTGFGYPSTDFPRTVEQPPATAPASAWSAPQPPRAVEPSHDREEFPGESITQVPTEVSLDIDVGPSTVRPTTLRAAARQRAEADRPARGGMAPGPIDLQLDLSQADSKSKRRDGKSG